MTKIKKRIAIIILSVLFVLTGLGAVFAPFVKINSVALAGSGTEASPYLIASANDLKAFRDSVNSGTTYAGKFVKLTSSIDLKYATFTPIGASTEKPFKGTFDGDNHTISGLYVANTNANETNYSVGLFGNISNATVKNLIIEDANVYSASASGAAGAKGGTSAVGKPGGNAIDVVSGGVAGQAVKSTVSNCHYTGFVYTVGGDGGSGGEAGTNKSGGGKAGGNGGNGASAYAGGIIGSSDGSVIERCSFVGDIYAYGGCGGSGGAGSTAYSSGYAGGRGGYGGAGGYVTAGGIVGWLGNDENNPETTNAGSVSQSYANIDMRLIPGMGGWGGGGRSGTSTSSGGVGGNGGQRGYLWAGGVVGDASGNIDNCFAVGKVEIEGSIKGQPANGGNGKSGNAYGRPGFEAEGDPELSFGGITGWAGFDITISNVYSDVTMTENHHYPYYFTKFNTRLAGIVGLVDCNATISNAVSLSKHYEATADVEGNVFSPIATFSSEDTATGTQGNSGDLQYVSDAKYINQNNGEWIAMDFNAMGDRVSTITSASNLTFGGVFKDFSQDIWEINSSVNGGLPVIKGVTFKEHKSTVYDVSTRDEFLDVVRLVNSGTPIHDLTINVNADMEIGEWTPMGLAINKTPAYLTVNGNNHVFTNMEVTKATDYKGLIGRALNADISDLTIEDPYITGDGGNYVGGIAGSVEWNGTIKNCHVIRSSKPTAQETVVRGRSYMGGIVGYLKGFNHGGKITDSSATVEVHVLSAKGSSTVIDSGGLAGMVSGTDVLRCYTAGDVYSDVHKVLTYYTGALIGALCNQSNVKDCFATGNVTGGTECSFIGNIDASSRGSKVENSYFTGAIKYNSTAAIASGSGMRFGGFIARISAPEVTLTNNAAFYQKYTTNPNNKSSHRRQGTLFSTVEPYRYAGLNAAGTSVVSYPTAKTNSYKFLRDQTNATNNYYAVNVNASNCGTYAPCSYFVNDKTTDATLFAYYSQEADAKYSFWRDSAGYDFENTWTWDPDLELPVLKGNEYSFPGVGGDSIEIATAEELAAFRDYVNAGNNYAGQSIKLVADIDLSSIANWAPIGLNATTYFAGTFDGDGHTISNMYMNKQSANKGLFATAINATIKNVTLKNPTITATAYANTGGIVGWMRNSEILNCHVVGGTIASTKENTGGIVGYIQLSATTQTSTVEGCSTTFDPAADGNTNVQSSLSGTSCVGGIVGRATAKAANKITITKCYSSRNVYGSTSYVGGIVGYDEGANISQCYTTGSVTADSIWMAGGIVGRIITYTASVTDCFTTGDVMNYNSNSSYNAYAGGIVGQLNLAGCRIENCYVLGNIMANNSPASHHAMTGGILALGNYASTYIGGCAVLSEKIYSSNLGVIASTTANYVRYASHMANGYNKTVPKASKANYYWEDCWLSLNQRGYAGDTTGVSSEAKPYDAFKLTATYQSDTLGLGWDFESVWAREDGVNDGLPYLKALGAPVYDLGSRFNPIPIASKEDFATLSDNVNNGICYNGVYVKQTADININGVDVVGYDLKHSFAGNYDGGDFKITGVELSAAASNIGVFGYVKFAGFKNVNVVKPKITQTGTGNNNVGGLVGYSYGNLSIDRCAVLGGAISNQGGNIGGLVGNADRGFSTVTRSFATAKIDGGKYVGGLVGLFRDGVVSMCYSRANVTATLASGYGAGGIVGVGEYKTRVYDSYAIGNISDTSNTTWSLAGGIVGVFHQAENYIYRCYFNGTVSAVSGKPSGTYTTSHAAGILGYTAVKTDRVIDCVSLATEYYVESKTKTYLQSAEILCGGTTAANLPTAGTNCTNNFALDGVDTYVYKTVVRRQAENRIESLDKFKSECQAILPNWEINSGDVWQHNIDTNKGLPTLKGLPSDNSELDEAIDLARSYKAEDWSAETYGNLTAIADYAEANAETMTDVQKREYINKIYAAIEALRPETTELRALYDSIMTNKVPYKEWFVNFATMDSALVLAKTVLEEDSNKYKNIDVELALSTLQMADKNLVVNKAKLNEAIIKANNIILGAEKDYTKEDIDNLKAVREKGVEVNNNAAATAKEVCEATEALNEALNSLRIDKSNLESKVKEAYEAFGGTVIFVDGKVVLGNDKVLTDDKFETTVVFNMAFDAAVAAYDDEAATGTTVSQCAYDLSVALNNLTVDKTKLSEACNVAGTKQKEQYTATSWAALETAMAAAKEELARDPAKPNQFVAYSANVDKVLADLLAAIENLAINKDYLKSLIDIATEESGQDIYDAESLQALNTALAAANAVYENNAATVEQVNNAAMDLNAAILNLRVNLDFLKEKIKQADLILSDSNENKKYYVVSTVDDLATARADAQTCVDDCSSLTEADKTNKVYIDKVKEATNALVAAIDGIKVDVEILKEYISIVTDETREDYIGKQGYAKESVDSIKTLGASAQAMLDEAGDSPDNNVILKAIKDFEVAFANMKADKTALAERVREVSSWTNTKHRQDNDGNWILDENGELKVFVVYEASTWDNLQTVLAAAVEVVNNPTASVADVKTASENLEQGILDLKIDSDELHDRIVKAEKIFARPEVFTQESRDLLKIPYDAAVKMYEIIEDPERKVRPTLDEAQAVLDALVYAIDHIVIDPTLIREMIALARTQEVNSVYYSELTYLALVTQTDMVEGLINDKICEADVDDFIAIIENAMNGLVIITDKLDSAIYMAESLNSHYITAATYQAITDALTAAHDLLDSGDLNVVDYKQKFIVIEDYKKVLSDLETAIEDIAPDIDNYKAFIAEKKPLLDGSYGEECLAVLQEAITNAENALTSTEEEFTYYVAIENIEAILAAEQALVPDTSALEEKIDEITEILNTIHTKDLLDEEGNVVGEDPVYLGKDMATYEYYTTASYQALQDEIAAAKVLIDNPGNYTTTDISNEYDKLVAAYDNLVLDKQLLLDLISECEALNKSYYTAVTYAALEAQIAQAKEFCQGTNNVILDYVTEYNALTDAREALKFETSTLENLIQQATDILEAAGKDEGEEGKRYYTQGSIDVLTSALQEANDFNPDAAGEGEEVDEAAMDEAYTMLCATLFNAIEGMVDIGGLKDKIAEAKAYTNEDGKYSEETFNALQTAIAGATSVYENSGATKKQVSDAIESLELACRALRLDVAGLDDILADAKALVAQADAGERFFTATTLNALKDQITVAEAFLASGSTDTAQLEKVKNDLSTALYGVIELTELVSKINAANDFVTQNTNEDGKWTAISYQALLDAIKAAEAVRDNAEATKDEIAEQVAKLSDINSILTLSGTSTQNMFTLIEGNTTYKFVDENGQPVEFHSVDEPAFLVNIALNDSIADVLSQFTNTDVKVFKADGETEITDYENTKVATGIILHAYSDGTVTDQLTLVLKCDINGDGKVNAVDKAQINAYFLGNKTLEGAYKLACDITGDGKINAIDKAQINAYFLGNKNIYDGLSVKENN